MKATACTVECFEPATAEENRSSMAGQIFARKGVAVLATGADSCTRMVYNAAAAMGAEERFFHCALTAEEYVLGTAEEKIRNRLNEILRLPNVTSVIIYTSCMDILSQVDYPAVIGSLDNKNGVPVTAFFRGPLVQRTRKPAAELKKILAELPAQRGELRQPKMPLPPLTPDFGSICTILQSWKIHNFLATAGGCSGCLVELPDHPEYRLHQSRLDDIQVALGCDELLENGIAGDAAAENASLTALVSGAALTMTGFDFNGLAAVLNNKGVRCVFLPANGFDPGPVGAAEAFLRLGKTMIEPAEKQADRVNIIGYDPMVFLSEAKIAHGIEHMERRSLDCYILGSRGEEDVKKASGAALNWVVSAAGLPLARYLEERFGTPYISGIPIGKYAMMHWRKKVNELVGRDDEPIELPAPAPVRSAQPKILLIGEPMLTESMAAFLKNDLGLTDTPCFVYDPHGQLRKLYKTDYPDLGYFADRESLEGLLETADGWIADPIYAECVEAASKVFVPVPEPLISGTRFADMPFEIFGKKGGAYLESGLKSILS